MGVSVIIVVVPVLKVLKSFKLYDFMIRDPKDKDSWLDRDPKLNDSWLDTPELGLDTPELGPQLISSNNDSLEARKHFFCFRESLSIDPFTSVDWNDTFLPSLILSFLSGRNTTNKKRRNKEEKIAIINDKEKIIS